ncbi:serine hydrolase [Dyella acidisoli]|uniref:Beta-lactamase n=1 Tax=Dyella acidisoli TaxID=1867834 RepID=A0ABQ5XV01_9GAMM|nr:serine hydrolase [Dyella acidisoli]GLQ94899.1 penicillin-binding protein [Dyella acidisoli]
MARTLRYSLIAAALYAGSATAMTNDQLQHVLEQRLRGDRTGACVAAAVIEGKQVARARVCADPADDRRIDEHSAFEIGSVSKTMTAALLAQLIEQGKASLDDPLSSWLPSGTNVPDFNGQPILLRHIVTHTSGLPGLPPRMQIRHPDNPYADLDESTVLTSLADVKLNAVPGTHFEYSNFAMMVLSDAVARRYGKDMDSLLRQHLFEPLGMRSAYLDKAPDGVKAAAGHLPNGKTTAAWTIPTNLAGVGGVHATLDDMVRYVQGELGLLDTPLTPALKLTQQPVSQSSGKAMGMNWMLVPHQSPHSLVIHGGGTGGFSSFVGFDPDKQRGVVLLSDTALNSMDGLGKGLGMHLLDPAEPLGSPRKPATPTDALLDGLAGEYVFANGMHISLRHRHSGLTAQVPGQPEFEMGYDSAGDFYPLQLDALLHPQRDAKGRYSFVWTQGGGAFSAERVDSSKSVASLAPNSTQLQAYTGDYSLAPGFVISITSDGHQLYAQATGQPRVVLKAVAADTFKFEVVAAEIDFERKENKVVALTLVQNGVRHHAEKH